MPFARRPEREAARRSWVLDMELNSLAEVQNGVGDSIASAIAPSMRFSPYYSLVFQFRAGG